MNDTALDVGDAPEPEELLRLLRRFGVCDSEPDTFLILSFEGERLLAAGDIDLDLDWICGLESFAVDVCDRAPPLSSVVT